MGKNISLLEMYKLVPTLLLNFVIELQQPEKVQNYNAWSVTAHSRPWNITDLFCRFVRQLNFNTTVKERTSIPVATS